MRILYDSLNAIDYSLGESISTILATSMVDPNAYMGNDVFGYLVVSSALGVLVGSHSPSVVLDFTGISKGNVLHIDYCLEEKYLSL
jgi:hypothetical protein